VGKNTNLIHPGLGSWLLLGELLLAVELPATGPGPEQGTCGDCSRCLDACPTGALVAPYVLDARRCISYLTIELKGAIPHELRPHLGNRIFGCDICQEVCPWNQRYARPTPEPAFQPGPDKLAPKLVDLLALDTAGFRSRFRTSPVLRAKRRGLLRNVAVALGNWGDHSTVVPLTRALGDDEPLVRGHAAWALGQMTSPEARSALAAAASAESDPWVQEEIGMSMQK
jgi:epoxyqueuosine reductase